MSTHLQVVLKYYAHLLISKKVNATQYRSNKMIFQIRKLKYVVIRTHWFSQSYQLYLPHLTSSDGKWSAEFHLQKRGIAVLTVLTQESFKFTQANWIHTSSHSLVNCSCSIRKHWATPSRWVITCTTYHIVHRAGFHKSFFESVEVV